MVDGWNLRRAIFWYLLIKVITLLISLAFFAVGYKYTNSSKCGVNFPHDFFSKLISLSAKFTAELCFSFNARFLENTLAQFALLM